MDNIVSVLCDGHPVALRVVDAHPPGVGLGHPALQRKQACTAG